MTKEKDELNRLNKNKAAENDELKNKITVNRDRVDKIGQDYDSSKIGTEEIVRANELLKNDLADLKQKIKAEKESELELKGSKDKINHTIYKSVDDNEVLKTKE